MPFEKMEKKNCNLQHDKKKGNYIDCFFKSLFFQPFYFHFICFNIINVMLQNAILLPFLTVYIILTMRNYFLLNLLRMSLVKDYYHHR